MAPLWVAYRANLGTLLRTMTTIDTPAEAFSPGEYLRDELDERGWTVTEFAEIIGRPVQAVSEILNGKKEITTDTACALGEALGTTPDLWLNLQTSYRLFQVRKRTPAPSLSPVARRARLRALLPLAEVRSRGWLPATDDLDRLEHLVRKLLGIATLDEVPSFSLAARRASSDEPLPLAQIAWLAHVRSTASAQRTAVYDRDALAGLAAGLPAELRGGPATLDEIPSRLAACGVALVFAEGLRGGKLDGAVTFLADGRPAIGLTTRGDRFDSLLFTLLHECAHLTLGHITAESEVIVDDDVLDADQDPKEAEANAQATAWLFPGGFHVGSTSMPSVLDAADRYQVHPGVIIGRLQRDQGNWKLHRAQIPKVRPVLRDAALLT